MKQKIKIIGFDLDGVILDHTYNKIRLAKSFGFKLSPKDTHSEIIKNIIPKLTWDKMQVILYDDPKISLQSRLMRGVMPVLAKVKNRFPYFLISRRRSAGSAIRIMKQKGLWPKFFNEGNTFFVLKRTDKNKIAKKLGVTHYIDDQVSVLKELADIKNKALFDNLNLFPELTKFRRINSWEELLDFIND